MSSFCFYYAECYKGETQADKRIVAEKNKIERIRKL